MDISISILTGLGLRLILFAKVPPGPLSNKLTAAILGLWEGAVVHQLSARASSSSASLDHILAFGLRLAVDLLLSRDAQRMMMILLWSSLSTVAAELIAPHESLRPKKSASTSGKDRRHRYSRSAPHIPNDVPIIQPPLPPRVRAYRPPSDPTPALPIDPPQLSSTPVFSQEPPTPPSFFLHETVASTSPSPKQVLMRSLASPVEEVFSPEQQVEALPVRPASGLATTLEAKADLSPSPIPVPVLLPTPPATTEGAPTSVSDAQRDNVPARFELYTIIEQSSPEDGLTPSDRNASRPTSEVHVPEEYDDTDTTPLPVPAPMEALPHSMHVRRRSSGNSHVDDWLAAQDTHTINDANALFTTPFSPDFSPLAPIPVLLRTRDRDFDSDNEAKGVNGSSEPIAEQVVDVTDFHDQDDQQNGTTPGTDINFPEPSVMNSFPLASAQALQPPYHSSDELEFESDELRTPIRRRDTRQPLEADDDEDDSDPLRTPKHLRHPIAHDSGFDSGNLEDFDQLSPLGLDVRSALAPDTDDTLDFAPIPISGPSRNNAPPPPSSIHVVAGAVYMPTAAMPVGLFTNFLCDDEVPTGGNIHSPPEANMTIPGSLDQNTLLLPPSPRRPIVPPLLSLDELTSSDNNAQPPVQSAPVAPVQPTSSSKSKGKGKGKAKAKTTSVFTTAPVAPAPAPPPAVVPPPPARSPPPPSPSTIISEGSELSVFSTKAPTRLWSRADALRREARECESRRAVIEEQRRRAESTGRALDVIQLRADLREIDRQVERLHEKAARRYYVARNLLPSPTKIDVHGLRPREASDRIDRAIIQAHKDGKRSVTVIVGKGLHSVNQQPTLKPVVLRDMQRLGLTCTVNPRNEGQLIITLPPALPPGGRA